MSNSSTNKIIPAGTYHSDKFEYINQQREEEEEGELENNETDEK